LGGAAAAMWVKWNEKVFWDESQAAGWSTGSWTNWNRTTQINSTDNERFGIFLAYTSITPLLPRMFSLSKMCKKWNVNF
jgi:hypothetical protein